MTRSVGAEISPFPTTHILRYLVFVVDLLSLDGVTGVKLTVSACQPEQHGPLQVHPQFGVQVFL